jgi:hypothetical protein
VTLTHARATTPPSDARRRRSAVID